MIEFNLPPVLFELHRRFNEAGFKVYLVGGAVRNLVLGKQPKDWDLCTNALPRQVMRIFPRVIPTGIQHGTVTVMHRGMPFEVTTFRVDGEYTDSRRPDNVIFTAHVEEDLARRDFTMNAMAISLETEELIDPFGGQADLLQGIIRTVGDPLQRFDEDGLRIARAMRFAAQLGFTIESSTWEAIPLRLGKLSQVSIERYRDELIKTICAPHACTGLSLYHQAGAFKSFLPEFHELASHANHLELFKTLAKIVCNFPEDMLALKIAALCLELREISETPLPHISAFEFCTRLKLPNQLRDQTAALSVAAQDILYAIDQEEVIRRYLSRHMPVARFAIMLQSECAKHNLKPWNGITWDIQTMDNLFSEVLSRKPALSLKELAINGNDLMLILGLKPSRRTGDILQSCLDYVLANPTRNTLEQLIDHARSVGVAE